MTPGSAAAKALGCTCREAENGFGVGANGGWPDIMRGHEFIVSEVCPMHGAAAWRMPHVSQPSMPGTYSVLVYDKATG